MFISRAHEVNAEVGSVEVRPRWGKGDGCREKLATRSEGEVDKGGEVEGVGRGRRLRVLAVLIQFARPRRAPLTIFGWWLGPPSVLQVEPGSISGLHTSHPLDPQTVQPQQLSQAALRPQPSSLPKLYNISEDPRTLPLFACLL
jgi:hypothetical protein